MQYLGLIGLALLLGLAWLFCEKRKSIKWRPVMAGFTLQVALSILLVKLPASRLRFIWLNKVCMTGSVVGMLV